MPAARISPDAFVSDAGGVCVRSYLAGELVAMPERDACPVHIVGGNLESDSVADENPDAEFTHFAGNGSLDHVSVGKSYAEVRVTVYFGDNSLKLKCFFLGHSFLSVQGFTKRQENREMTNLKGMSSPIRSLSRPIS